MYICIQIPSLPLSPSLLNLLMLIDETRQPWYNNTSNVELQSLTVVFSLERKRKPRLGMQPFDLEEIGKDIQRAPEFGPDGY